ncbi:hypothetical protein GW820_06395 [archaeon]|nr:hypothetical protein [archaeon]
MSIRFKAHSSRQQRKKILQFVKQVNNDFVLDLIKEEINENNKEENEEKDNDIDNVLDTLDNLNLKE